MVQGMDLRRTSLGACVAAILTLSMAGVSSQTNVALSSLTVPDKRLPDGCKLRPVIPAATAAAPPPGATTVVAHLPSRGPFPTNPWLGADRQSVRELRARIDGAPAGPDAPPMNASQRAAWDSRWVEHIIDGYHAVYDAGPDLTVDVSAVRFDDVKLATTTPLDVARGSRPTDDRIVVDAAIVQVVQLPVHAKTECFRAIDAHIRSLK